MYDGSAVMFTGSSGRRLRSGRHPLHLYAMGKVAARAVPNIVVFDNQGSVWIQATSTAPPVDTRLRGGTRIVTMSDILGRYGPRTGPVQSVWRRATILISVGRLATPQEMNYLELLCQADRRACEHDELSGVPCVSSFHRQPDASPDRYRCHRPPESDTEGPDHVPELLSEGLARRCIRPPRYPSRFRVNQSYRLRGRVTVTDRAYHAALILHCAGRRHVEESPSFH